MLPVSEYSGGSIGTHFSCTVTAFRPLATAVAVTARVWLDCTPPIETSVSHPLALASATRYSSCCQIGLTGTHLADLVAAVCETRITVLAFGVDVYLPTKLGSEVWEMADG